MILVRCVTVGVIATNIYVRARSVVLPAAATHVSAGRAWMANVKFAAVTLRNAATLLIIHVRIAARTLQPAIAKHTIVIADVTP